jgi:hypothetical protein
MTPLEEFLHNAATEIERLYVELWRGHESREPTRLFHYTSTEGLVGIISSQKFFLSDMLASSDRSEIRYGVKLAIDVLKLHQSHALGRELLASFQRGNGLLGLGESYFLHGMCFYPGEDVLTQWRGYSSTGGFAIGLNFKKLRERAERGEFAVARMLYEKDTQKELLERTVVHGIELFDRLLPTLKGLPPSDTKRGSDGFLLEVGMSMLKSIYHFKNEAFKSEDEWRVLMIDSIDDLVRKQKFRYRGNSIVPYVELAFEPDLIGWIHRSPGLWPSSVDYAVSRLARSLGGRVVVDVSKLPL